MESARRSLGIADDVVEALGIAFEVDRSSIWQVAWGRAIAAGKAFEPPDFALQHTQQRHAGIAGLFVAGPVRREREGWKFRTNSESTLITARMRSIASPQRSRAANSVLRSGNSSRRIARPSIHVGIGRPASWSIDGARSMRLTSRSSTLIRSDLRPAHDQRHLQPFDAEPLLAPRHRAAVIGEEHDDRAVQHALLA
jgi:hypothetical protein